MAESAVYRASIRGARRAGFDLDAAGRRQQTFMLSEFARLTPILTRTARDWAPHDSGRLERGIKAIVSSRGGRIIVTLISTAVSDEGFAYTDVTRFGHRKARIYPKPPNRFLRWPSRQGGYIFARSVRGFKPTGDWVKRAMGSWERDVDAAAGRLSRAIDTRLL